VFRQNLENSTQSAAILFHGQTFNKRMGSTATYMSFSQDGDNYTHTKSVRKCLSEELSAHPETCQVYREINFLITRNNRPMAWSNRNKRGESGTLTGLVPLNEMFFQKSNAVLFWDRILNIEPLKEPILP